MPYYIRRYIYRKYKNYIFYNEIALKIIIIIVGNYYYKKMIKCKYVYYFWER